MLSLPYDHSYASFICVLIFTLYNVASIWFLAITTIRDLLSRGKDRFMSNLLTQLIWSFASSWWELAFTITRFNESSPLTKRIYLTALLNFIIIFSILWLALNFHSALLQLGIIQNANFDTHLHSSRIFFAKSRNSNLLRTSFPNANCIL